MGGPAQAPIFSPGEIVSARYRISTYLGQGAAGEVYGAEDLHLRSRVALKVLRPGASRDPQSIERFKREILLARRVSHPNVCRIFDLGIHEVRGGGEGSWQSLLFLTMEWLEGETLSRRIQEAGGFDEGPAVAIVRQLVRGLAAAHDAGIVHRDLKSSNILLVPGADGERAVITDFGLARSSHQSADGLTLTEAGGLLGTPAYMAPEQVAGLPATAASDIYALGVVLYEMLTGALPFHGESPLEVAVKRLREPPTPIETYRAGISARFRETIERCMAQEPEKRFADAEAVIRFLDPPTAAARWRAAAAPAYGVARSSRGSRSSPRWASRRRSGGTCRRGEISNRAEAGHRRRLGGPRAPRPPARSTPCARPSAAARRAIAVLGFANATGRPEAQWLSSALSEMLTSELAANDAVRAVPGEVVAQARQDLGLALSSALGRGDAAAPAPHPRRGSGAARQLHRPGRRRSAAACRPAPPGDRRQLHQAVLDRRQRGGDLRPGARGRARVCAASSGSPSSRRRRRRPSRSLTRRVRRPCGSTPAVSRRCVRSSPAGRASCWSAPSRPTPTFHWRGPRSPRPGPTSATTSRRLRPPARRASAPEGCRAARS